MLVTLVSDMPQMMLLSIIVEVSNPLIDGCWPSILVAEGPPLRVALEIQSP